MGYGKRLFEEPTQVKFYNAPDENWLGGIAFGAAIICGCCGGVVEIDDIYEEAKENGIDNPIEELRWIEISEAIIGE
jgi:hypothetical protein